MSSIRSYPHAVSINSTYYSGIVGYSVNPNTEKAILHHDGLVDPVYACALNQKPEISIRSVDLANVLAAVDFSGVALTELTTWFQKGADCATRASGTDHTKIVATSGCAVLMPLRATNNQIVEAEVQAYLKSSTGLADPFTITTGISLAGSTAATAKYTMGPVYITPSGGSRAQLTVSDWEFDPGIEIEAISDDGLPFPTYIAIHRRAPKFRCTYVDMSKLATYTFNGALGSIEAFLRKVSETGAGSRVANATEEHIKITIADGRYQTDDSSVDDGSTATGTLMHDATYDGTNPIVDIEFDVAIA